MSAGREAAEAEFVYTVTVRLHHTDAAGVLFCSRLLELAHEAYEALLEREGLAMAQILAAGAYRLPVVAAQVEFARPIRVGDRLQIELALNRRGSHSYEVAYRFRDRAGATCATALTRHVAVDGATGRPCQLPAALARLADCAG